MIAAFLITLREAIEASLIVATILGVLTKLNERQSIKTVWMATCAALITSFVLVFFGSTVGIHIQRIYAGKSEPLVEGTLLLVSSLFVTWAVFVLHHHFARKKMHLLQRMNETLRAGEQRGIFILAFTAVLREGLEIALFLSTLYLTSTRASIVGGFVAGTVLGIMASGILFRATVRMPIRTAFRVTSFLLILFAGGLLARGIGELLEMYTSNQLMITFPLLPAPSTILGGFIETVFGITRSMHAASAILYTAYLFLMHRWVFVREDTSEA